MIAAARSYIRARMRRNRNFGNRTTGIQCHPIQLAARLVCAERELLGM